MAAFLIYKRYLNLDIWFVWCHSSIEQCCSILHIFNIFSKIDTLQSWVWKDGAVFVNIFHQSSPRGATVNTINLFHFLKGAPELNEQGCRRLPSKLCYKSAAAAFSSDWTSAQTQVCLCCGECVCGEYHKCQVLWAIRINITTTL